MTEDIYGLHSRGRVIEELFFFKQNSVLIEKKLQLQKLERDLKTIAGISGISNEDVLRKLVELNVQVEVLATLLVIPLIEVAWADGKIKEGEREAILKAAESTGVHGGPHHSGLFEHWLEAGPPKGFLESWIFYMQGLCRLLSESERQALESDILQRARTVAEAGGAGSKSKVSRKKSDVLLQLESAFKL
jgi:hypothetical protein